MKLFLATSILASTIFMKTSHPIGLMAIILAQTLILCLMIWVSSKLNWFSYILFLIFLGGLMVLFVYISSLASNEMFDVSLTKSVTSYITLGVVGTLIVTTPNNQMTEETCSQPIKSFNSIYAMPLMAPTAMTMIYLLLTLVVVVKMTSKYSGPMRNMIFKN